jgi:hypothetical protein
MTWHHGLMKGVGHGISKIREWCIQNVSSMKLLVIIQPVMMKRLLNAH